LRRIATRATIGGTASAITGGKFGNGAITAGFAAALGESWESYGRPGPANKELALNGENAKQQNAQPEQDEGKWVRAGEVIGEGSEETFRLGHKIKIEGADDKASLHANHSAYELTFTEIGANGQPVPGVYPIYKGTLSSGLANSLSTDRVIELYGPVGKKFDWNLKLNRIPKTCDNCGSPMIKIYDWKTAR